MQVTFTETVLSDAPRVAIIEWPHMKKGDVGQPYKLLFNATKVVGSTQDSVFKGASVDFYGTLSEDAVPGPDTWSPIFLYPKGFKQGSYKTLVTARGYKRKAHGRLAVELMNNKLDMRNDILCIEETALQYQPVVNGGSKDTDITVRWLVIKS